MSVLPRPSSPPAVWGDLREMLARGDRRQKLLGGAVAVGMTSLIVTGFIVESWWGVLPEGEEISYVADYSNARSDAEIIAQQRIDQRKADAAKEARRREWQKVDRQLSGIGL